MEVITNIFIIWKKRTNGIIMREFVKKWEVLITVIISITSIFLATKANEMTFPMHAQAIES